MRCKCWLFCALLSGCTGAASDDPSSTNSTVQALSGKTTAVAYHDQWRKLFEDHITWTRLVIVGVANKLPGTDAYTTRLLSNYEDMEDALRGFFPDDDIETLGDLLKDHLVTARSILDTVAKGGDPTALIATWRQNGSDIAGKMSAMNPRYWPLEVGAPMWQDHLTFTLEEATAAFAGTFEADIAAYDKVHVLALDMADFFSVGVIRTGYRFKGEQCIP